MPEPAVRLWVGTRKGLFRAENVLDALEEVKSLPYESEPDDGLVASEDHDAILYDGTSHIGFPEKPLK